MLPLELLQRILTEVAVADELARPLCSLSDTYRHLAAVCRRWRDALSEPDVWRGVRRRVIDIGESKHSYCVDLANLTLWLL